MFPPQHVIYKYSELDSTNAEALRLLNKNAIKDKTVIVANKQNQGRGRNGKVWVSTGNNLYMTIVVEKSVDIKSISQLSFIAAVAVGESLTGVQYKWPNDILLKSKKVSGILLEYHDNSYIIVGIGVNINSAPNYATYVNEHHNVDAENLLQRIVSNFDNEKNQWLINGFKQVREKWLARVWNLNENLTVNLNKQVIEGKFVDLDIDGKLVLKNQCGIHKINSGEVF